MNNTYYNFVKNAALYTQQTAQVVDMAYGALQDIRKQRQKVAAMTDDTVRALSELTKTNGQPFVPEGLEKRAEACLQSHSDTVKLLNHVIGEYAKLKEASDNQMPAMGQVRGKAAAEKRPVVFDSPESNAMRMWTERLLDI